MPKGGYMKAKKLTLLSVFVALSMILSFIESQIPPLSAIPGIKLGLANSATVFILYALGGPYALLVSVVRVVLSSLLFGSAVSLAYSLSGALLSLAAMVAMKRIKKFSYIGVSALGAVMHNAGQIICAVIILENAAIALYFPALIISGTVAGAAVGTVAGIVLARLKKHKIIDEK